MRNLPLLLIVMLSLSGCMQMTRTDIPSLSGVVVDSNSGAPLEHVVIDNQVSTSKNGQFSLAGTTKTFWAMPAPASMGMVSRPIVFQKKGYRSTACTSTRFRVTFGSQEEENTATIPLVKVDASEPMTTPPVFLGTNHEMVGCQVFVGSRVKYHDAVYIVGEIEEKESGTLMDTFFTLWPIFPNDGDVVMDVTGDELLIIANEPAN